jgi:hypothetical protein
LRKAIQTHQVIFPLPVPDFASEHRPDIQWRLVELYFIQGWSCARLSQRYKVTDRRIQPVDPALGQPGQSTRLSPMGGNECERDGISGSSGERRKGGAPGLRSCRIYALKGELSMSRAISHCPQKHHPIEAIWLGMSRL